MAWRSTVAFYELARVGTLPVKPMGRGKKRRGYRVLLSDLLEWEARVGDCALDAGISKMLSSNRDGRRVPAASSPPRDDSGSTGRPARRPPDHAVSMGAGPERHPGAGGAT